MQKAIIYAEHLLPNIKLLYSTAVGVTIFPFMFRFWVKT